MSVNKNTKSHVFGLVFNRKTVQYSYKIIVWKEEQNKTKLGSLCSLTMQNFTLFRDIQTKITEYLSQRHKVWHSKFLMS